MLARMLLQALSTAQQQLAEERSKHDQVKAQLVSANARLAASNGQATSAAAPSPATAGTSRPTKKRRAEAAADAMEEDQPVEDGKPVAGHIQTCDVSIQCKRRWLLCATVGLMWPLRDQQCG